MKPQETLCLTVAEGIMLPLDRKRSLLALCNSGSSFSQQVTGTSLNGTCNFSKHPQPQPQPQQPPQKRRRVTFSSVGAPMVHEVASRSELTQGEKKQLWIQNEDIQLSISCIRKTFRRKDAKTNTERTLYGQTLFSTYLACCADSTDSESIPESLSPQTLQLLGTGRGDNRGLESCAVPSMALERNQKRRAIIAKVVALHRELKGIPEEPLVLRSVAEGLSRPSRKFAQAMGLGDTLAAVLVYSLEQTKTTGAFFRPSSSSFDLSQSSSMSSVLKRNTSPIQSEVVVSHAS